MGERIFPILFLKLITTNAHERHEIIKDYNPTN